MKICVDMGHTKASPGARKYIDELTEDRKIGAALIAELKKRGHTVIDTTPADSVAYPAEVNQRVAKANASGASLFVSVHLNAGGGTGTECMYYQGDKSGATIAGRISENVANVLGLRNRGAKARTNEVGVIANTVMTAVLVEVCFVDSQTDKAAYQKVTAAALAVAIANGIEGKAASVKAGWKKNGKGWWYQNADGTWPKAKWKKIGGDWYYFNSSGYAVSSCCMKINGKWYAFGSDCRMKTSVKVDGSGALQL